MVPETACGDDSETLMDVRSLLDVDEVSVIVYQNVRAGSDHRIAHDPGESHLP